MKIKKCPWCKTRKYLTVQADLASLNYMEHYIECTKCGTIFYGRHIENSPAISEKEILKRWNSR